MTIKNLMRVLFQRLGNKRYLYDLEILLEKYLNNLQPDELQTINYLIQDLHFLK